MYETLFRHVFFPVYEGWIKKRPTAQRLKTLDKQQWLSPDDLAALQLKRLNALLDFAWKEAPFLRQYWGDHGCRPGALKDVSELAAYPVLTKKLIRDNFEGMSPASQRDRSHVKTTSGSTGEPFKLRFSDESYASRNAAMWRGYRWAGTDLGCRTLYLWGLPLNGLSRHDALFHAAYNRRMLNSFALSRDNAAEYVAQINAHKPRTIVSYVAPLVALSEWILETGAKVHSPESIVTGAEALNPTQRKVIEAAFKAPAYNTYGSREFGLIGAECSERRGMHLTVDQLVIETVDDDHRPVHGRPGHVLVTDTTNYAMPFVRYSIGDTATRSDARCACGRGLPLFSSLEGRTLDLIRTRDGRLVPGEFFPFLLMNYPFIAHYQAIQHDLDHLEVRLVANESVKPDEASLRQIDEKLKEALGREIETHVHFVEDLPVGPTGKRRLTISHVGPLDASRVPAPQG